MIKTNHLEKINELPYFYNKVDPLWYKKVLSLDGKNIQALYQLAREKEKKGLYAEALSLYEKCYSYGLTSAIVDVNRLEGIHQPLIRRVLGTPPGNKKIMLVILLILLALAALLGGILYIYNHYFQKIVENYYHQDFIYNIYYLNDPSSASSREAPYPGQAARRFYVTFPYHASPREMAERIKEHAENDRIQQPGHYKIYYGPGFNVGQAPPPGGTYIGEANWAVDGPPRINLFLRTDLHRIKPGDGTPGAMAGPVQDPVKSGGATPDPGEGAAFYGNTALPSGSGSRGVYAIYVDKSENRLYLYREGVMVRSFPAALGRENKTPSGKFLITNKAVHRRGSVEFDSYGSGWMGINLSMYGLHGTNNPGDVGGNITEGCIRLMNEDIICLIETVPLSTPVIIN